MLIRGFYYEGFMVLAGRVTEGEIEDVLHVLPSEIRDLWPAEAVSLPRS